jgi:hypothetical protein
LFNSHSQFQLYHCSLPKDYLKKIREKGLADSYVTLNRTKLFEFGNLKDRAEWVDLFLALMQYLISGEAKVGYLNRHHPRNPLHRVCPNLILANSSILKTD